MFNKVLSGMVTTLIYSKQKIFLFEKLTNISINYFIKKVSQAIRLRLYPLKMKRQNLHMNDKLGVI